MVFSNVVLITHGNREHPLVMKTIQLIKLKAEQVQVFDRAEISSSTFKKADLVICLGGDGTFLRVSHFIKGIPMLGINSDPKKKEGFFLKINSDNLKQSLKYIFGPKIKKIKLPRLFAKINGQLVDELALNEFYIGPKKPYQLFNYDISDGNVCEYQRSSGILIGTPAGSHSWIGSSGGVILPLEEKVFQVIARENFIGGLNPSPLSIQKKVYEKNTIIKIVCKSYDGIIVADSVGEERAFNKGDVIEIGLSDDNLDFLTLG